MITGRPSIFGIYYRYWRRGFREGCDRLPIEVEKFIYLIDPPHKKGLLVFTKYFKNMDPDRREQVIFASATTLFNIMVITYTMAIMLCCKLGCCCCCILTRKMCCEPWPGSKEKPKTE